MRSHLAGVVVLICAVGIPVDTFAQERTGRARNQPLKEQIKSYDVMTTQSLPTAASPNKRPEVNDGASDVKKRPRPTIIEGPGYNKGISAPSR